MRNVQRFDAGEDHALFAGVDDAYQTMALVEARFDSLKMPGTPLDLS